MRAVWVDNGSDPDYVKLAKYGITDLYFDPRDPRITAAYLDAVKTHPQVNAVGLFFASDWWGGLNMVRFAEKIDSELKRIAWKGNAVVCADIETVSLASDLQNFLSRWRELRPTRQTAVTIEGMKGGLLDQATVDAIVKANVRLVPQLYLGDMAPAAHSPVLDLLIAGVPGDIIDGFYDGARLPYRWRGFAFQQSRIP